MGYKIFPHKTTGLTKQFIISFWQLQCYLSQCQHYGHSWEVVINLKWWDRQLAESDVSNFNSCNLTLSVLMGVSFCAVLFAFTRLVVSPISTLVYYLLTLSSTIIVFFPLLIIMHFLSSSFNISLTNVWVGDCNNELHEDILTRDSFFVVFHVLLQFGHVLLIFLFQYCLMLAFQIFQLQNAECKKYSFLIGIPLWITNNFTSETMHETLYLHFVH